MVRNNRLLNRIFFALVLAAGLLGAAVFGAMWRVDVNTLEAPLLDQNTDWVDAVSLLSEELIQFFLGWTN